MKKSLCTVLVVLLFIAGTTVGFAQVKRTIKKPEGRGPQEPKVHPEVWRKVKEKGIVNVIVELDMAWRWEDKLSKQEIAAQRKAIVEAQKKLLAELAGTKHKVGSLHEMSPLLSLNKIDANTLTILENSPLVLRVNENRILRTTLFRSVPFVGVDQSTTGSFDGTGFSLAILDTGVENKVIAEWCFSEAGDCPEGGQVETGEGSARPCNYVVDCGHGTHVAGIAAGTGPEFSGVAKGATILAVQVFSKFTGAQCPPGQPVCAQVITNDLIEPLEQDAGC